MDITERKITADLDAETESRVLEALRHASLRAHRPLHLPPRVRKSRRQDGGAPTAVRQKRHPASGRGMSFYALSLRMSAQGISGSAARRTVKSCAIAPSGSSFAMTTSR